ncbi:MAG TPA: multiheme c-type cytochrome [Bryobacteraceae bacterium]
MKAVCFQAFAAYLCVACGVSYAQKYVGSAACAACHETEYKEQTASRMAHALRPIEGSLIGEIMLKQGHSPDGRLTYGQSANGIVVREKGFPDTVTLKWAFGTGKGSTAVGLLDGQYIAHRFSYYSQLKGLAVTFGHPPHPTSPITELGVLQDSRTIFRCFNCHGTNARVGPNGPVLTRYMPGVQCERCHGPGGAHVKAVKGGASPQAIRSTILNPGRFSPKALIEFCGQCHRLPEPDMGTRPELVNPVSVRFAPIGLLASRCFRFSQKISCLTCHNPHENPAPRTDMSYTRACLACHADDPAPEKLCRRKEKENCLPCHMKQAFIGPYLQFTDHRIRVYQ